MIRLQPVGKVKVSTRLRRQQTEGEYMTVKRSGVVEVAIDVEAIAHECADRALRNSTQRSKALHGAIVVKLIGGFTEEVL